MKHSRKFSIPVCLLAMTLSLEAGAKTNVAEKVAQLKENAESSKANLKQYEDGLKIVNANLIETEKALKALKRQKETLAKQTSESNKGKLGVDAVKKQLDGYMQAEKEKLETERKQMEELRKALAQLEENARKREENLARYEEKSQKVDRELASWSERNQSIVELEQAILEKETQARSEQKRLAEKKDAYEAEVAKWKKQVRVSERSYENFAQLKD